METLPIRQSSKALSQAIPPFLHFLTSSLDELCRRSTDYDTIHPRGSVSAG